MEHTTDNLQVHRDPYIQKDNSTVTQNQMPQAEHQYPQRPIQLRDLKQYSKPRRDQQRGCVSSFEQSGGGDIKFLWSWIGKKRRHKTMDAARGKRKGPEDTGQGAHEIVTSVSLANTPSASIPDELVGPPHLPPSRHTPSSSIYSHNPRDSRRTQDITAAPQAAILRKPVHKYRDTQGAVARHSVRVTKPSVIRRSAHLERTASNNFRVSSEPTSPKIRNASRITNFGDFISQEALSTQIPSPSGPSPPAPNRAVVSILPHKGYRGTRWTFAAADALISPTIDSTNTISKIQSPSSLVDRGECSMCGSPNSPGTHHGDQGLWLCTACRSPTSAVELPPRTTSKILFEQRGQRSDLQVSDNIHDDKNGVEACESCHTTLRPIEKEGILLCSWCCKQLSRPTLVQDSSRDSHRLTLLKVRRQRSLASINTQDAEEEWQQFDSDAFYETTAPTSSPKSPDIPISNGKSEKCHHWQEPSDEFMPTPPLKDSIYLSRKVYVPPTQETSTPSPPPKSRRKAPPHHIHTSHTPSPPPPTPPKPRTYTQSQNSKTNPLRPRKTSSIYPPTPALNASTFPYPPPPIPQTHLDLRKALRASSVYTVGDEEGVPRLQTPDWELKSPNRDTSFYGFWEVLLRDDGVVREV